MSPDADSDFLTRAVESGAGMRAKLRELAETRKKQAERTNARIEEMSKQLKEMMEKIRSQTGMPPEKSADTKPTAAASKPAGIAKNAPSGDLKRVEDGNSASPGTSSASRPCTSASAPASYEDSSSGEPYMDPNMFGFDSTAGWQILANSDILPDNESNGNVQFRIEWDMNGCSIIEISGDAPPGPGVRQKYVQSGKGFRVGYDPESPKSFCGMVGNEEWLLALSYDEIRHFKRLCLALRKKMERIEKGEEDPPVKKPAVRRSGDGMFNERVGRTGSDCSVELESKLVWVQAFGQPELGKYGIRAIFMEGRQSEGYWAPPIAQNMLGAVAKLQVE